LFRFEKKQHKEKKKRKQEAKPDTPASVSYLHAFSRVNGRASYLLGFAFPCGSGSCSGSIKKRESKKRKKNIKKKRESKKRKKNIKKRDPLSPTRFRRPVSGSFPVDCVFLKPIVFSYFFIFPSSLFPLAPYFPAALVRLISTIIQFALLFDCANPSN
jgi:hypothetical protein